MLKEFGQEMISMQYDAYGNEDLMDEDLLFAKLVGEKLQEYEANTPTLLNPHSIQRFELVKRFLSLYATAHNLSFSSEMMMPSKRMASITMSGDFILFEDAFLLAACSELSTNTEVTPLTNGKIELTFGFNDITKPLID